MSVTWKFCKAYTFSLSFYVHYKTVTINDKTKQSQKLKKCKTWGYYSNY